MAYTTPRLKRTRYCSFKEVNITMRHFQAILVAASILVLLFSSPGSSLAQDGPAPEVTAGKLTVEGTVTDVEGLPIRSAKVTISSGQIVREAICNKDGKFRIKGLSSKTANVAYEARGYNRIEENGMPLTDGMDLSQTLQEKRADSRSSLLLFIPGVLGLGLCALCDYRRKKEKMKKKDKAGQIAAKEGVQMPSPTTEPDPQSDAEPDNQFLMAAAGGAIWGVTLVALVLIGGLGPGGVNSLYLFHWSLPMEVYVPAFGFVGSLLFVLDIRRRFGGDKPTETPKEDIPKGKEFGMRMFMGPYVAIVVVALFGEDIGLANFTSPEAKASLAFFSGLLVVAFLQYLVEKGQEALGERRRKSRQDILNRRKDELKEAMGDIVWARLRGVGVSTVSGFAHLDDAAFEGLAGGDPRLVKSDLITFRDEAKKLAMAS